MTTSPAGTVFGTSLDATSSFMAIDSGANIGTRSMSSSSAERTIGLSISTSRRTRSDRCDDRRRGDRPDRDASHGDSPNETEHPGEGLVGDDALKESEDSH